MPKAMNLYTFALFAIGFLLFLEWLRPLQQISDIGAMNLLLLFTLLLFLLAYLQTPFWLAVPVTLFAILFVLQRAHFFVPFFDFAWLQTLSTDLLRTAGFLVTRRWDLISDVGRTFLFLLLLCLMGYLLKYWLLQTRNAFLFLLMTVVYVAIIDTFTVYDASIAIIRIVVFGFVLIGLLEIAKVQEREGFGSRLIFPVKWVFFVMIMISFVSLFGFLAPKAEPQWADPVPFLKSAANIDRDEKRASKVKKIGFGSDDSRLGGSFQMDDTPVFTADSEVTHYWRAETKDVYTGKGWESTAGDTQPFHAADNLLYEEQAVLEEKQATIRMTGQEEFPFLFYSAQLTNVATSDQAVSFQENLATGKIATISRGEEISLREYTLTYDYPTFSIEKLREAGTNYPREIRERYLQLPDSLPKRVQELAYDITSEQATAYEKAKALERFFAGNGFAYDTQDVAVPGRNDDYVDQFLFETKRGYCDNFSTSMVVMLRSIGIPARWVKGFTDGDYQETLADGTRRHVITNEHAHSWVEAYFPGSGWVPFEPTRGFVNPFPVENDLDSSDPRDEQKEDERDDRDEEPEREEASAQKQDRGSTVSLALGRGHWVAIVAVLLLFVLSIAVVTQYKRWAKQWLLFRFRNRDDEAAFDDAYEKLLWLLSIYGFKRKPQQTLREYAVELDRHLGGNDMKMLTKEYEKRLYHHEKEAVNWFRLQKLWKNVIGNLAQDDRP